MSFVCCVISHYLIYYTILYYTVQFVADTSILVNWYKHANIDYDKYNHMVYTIKKYLIINNSSLYWFEASLVSRGLNKMDILYQGTFLYTCSSIFFCMLLSIVLKFIPKGRINKSAFIQARFGRKQAQDNTWTLIDRDLKCNMTLLGQNK